MYFALTLKAICKFRGCNYVCCVVSCPPRVSPCYTHYICQRHTYCSYYNPTLLPFFSLPFSLNPYLSRCDLYTLPLLFLHVALLVIISLLWSAAALPGMHYQPHRLSTAPPLAGLTACLFIVFSDHITHTYVYIQINMHINICTIDIKVLGLGH